MNPSTQERFLQALQAGNTTRIELYLKKYPEAATISVPDLGSPIHYAIHHTPLQYLLDVIQLLFRYDADPNQTMQQAWNNQLSETIVTPLRLAAGKGLSDVVNLLAHHPNISKNEAALFINRPHFLSAMLETKKIAGRYTLAPSTWYNRFGEPANISYLIVGPDYSHDERCTEFIKKRITPQHFPEQLAQFEEQMQIFGRFVGVNFHRSEFNFAAVTIAFIDQFIDEIGTSIAGLGNTEFQLARLSSKGTACVVLRDISLKEIHLPHHQHTLVHELGHIISLKHPMKLARVKDPHILPDDEATTFNSVMAYQHMLPKSQFSREVQAFFPEKDLALFATTPMPYDITTARLLYGLNKTTHAGNTTHYFHNTHSKELPNNYVLNVTTLLDTDGFNTLDTSNCKGNTYIDTTHTPFGKMIFGCISLQRLAFETHINSIISGSGNDLIVADNNVTEITTDVGFDTVELFCHGPHIVFTDLDHAIDDLRFNLNAACAIQAMTISDGQLRLTVGENSATAMQVWMPAKSESSYFVTNIQVARSLPAIKVLIPALKVELSHCVIDQNNYLRCFPGLPKIISIPFFCVTGFFTGIYIHDFMVRDNNEPNLTLLMLENAKFALSTHYYAERLAYEFGYKLSDPKLVQKQYLELVKEIAVTAADFGIQYTSQSIVAMVSLITQPCVAAQESWQQQRSENNSFARAAFCSFFAGLDSAIESIAKMAPGGQQTLDYQNQLLN